MNIHGWFSSLVDPSPVTLPPPRERFNYLPYHTEVLNGIYDVYKYPNREQRQVIAQRLIIKAQQVRVSPIQHFFFFFF